MKGLLIGPHIVAFMLMLAPLKAEDPVFQWVENGDVELIETYLETHDVNARYGNSGMTLLVYSILHGKTTTASQLVKLGADVDMHVRDISPLMYASGRENPKKVELLINSGARIADTDPDGNTALFYAAGNGYLDNSKFLVKNGASLLHKNHSLQTAYDFAVRHGKQEVARYLRTQYEKNLPDMVDGPYMKWRGKSRLKAFYMVHDSKRRMTRRVKARFKTDSVPVLIHGFAGDSLEYSIDYRREVPPDIIRDAEQVMVIGDIHGGYDSLVLFLKNNGVIDAALNWSWGNGHLVFVGDIFDRGDMVTEALWLIYRLESQALRSGGMVHMILGNHEIMVLSGDIYYVSDKYLLMSDRLNVNYSYLFSKRTVLGQWLRSRNTITRINGHMFVHAGLSPDITELGLDMQEINENIRFFLNHPDRMENGTVSRASLMEKNGPFWYRGYLEGNHEYDHLSEKGLQQVLEYFDAGYIFVGHTNVDQVTPLYQNRVFAIDVPFYTYGYSMYGLLLEGDDVYLLNTSARKKQIR